MLFDLNASHPTLRNYDKENIDTLQRSISPVLEYQDFLKARQSHRQEQQQLAPPHSQRSYATQYPPSHFTSNVGNRYEQISAPETPECLMVQNHLANCEICRRYAMWRCWNDVSHWVIFAIIAILILRKN